MDTTSFTPQQHEIWRRLYARQTARLQDHACREYLEGFERLALPPDHIPSLAYLNQRLTPLTGWKCVRTSVRYSDAVPWYHHFARREFLVTDFMRSATEMAFTPEPDMFHDIYGHLPYLTLPRFARLEELFAPAFLRAGPEQRENIKRLAWFSTEFGLLREDGELKMFGAGLLSSVAEMDHVLAGRTRLMPFTVENVIRHDKAIYSFNETLFVFDSLETLQEELVGYFDTIEGDGVVEDGYRGKDWDLRDAYRQPVRSTPEEKQSER